MQMSVSRFSTSTISPLWRIINDVHQAHNFATQSHLWLRIYIATFLEKLSFDLPEPNQTFLDISLKTANWWQHGGKERNLSTLINTSIISGTYLSVRTVCDDVFGAAKAWKHSRTSRGKLSDCIAFRVWCGTLLKSSKRAKDSDTTRPTRSPSVRWFAFALLLFVLLCVNKIQWTVR